MVLSNVILLNGHEPVNVNIHGRHFSTISARPVSLIEDNFQVEFKDAMAFPGLVNSHDHLDFDCFSPLGNKVYNNYTEWGGDIHRVYKEEINAVLKIPQELRIAWGIYKNLLAGVTAVVNHGNILSISDSLITVRQDFQNLHSVKFEKFWKWKLNNPWSARKTCVIHCGEGSDAQSTYEIDKLLRWNLLNRALIAVHAVAMNPTQAKKFMAIIWCPESNNILLNKHANIEHLKQSSRVVFGTDSTLTGNWNAWHHLRLARATKQVSDVELYEMVTCSPAKLWDTRSGKVKSGKRADLVITRRKHGHPGWNDFYETNPEDILLVLQNGNIRLFDVEYLDQLKQRNFNAGNFYPVTINGCTKYVEGNIPALMDDIRKYYPAAKFPCNIPEKIKEAAHA